MTTLSLFMARFTKTVLLTSIFGGVLLAVFSFSTQLAFAQYTNYIDLDVCDTTGFCDDNLNVLDGQQVELKWYIEGLLSDCRLYAGSNLLQSIDTSSLPDVPATGSVFFTPQSGEESNFSVNCYGTFEIAEEVLPPSVSISIDGADTKQYDPYVGGVPYTRVRWSSEHTTRCDPWVATPVANPAGAYSLPVQYDNWDVGKTSGNIWFDLPIPYMQESTTFSITCENENTGETASDSVTLTVLAAAPPDPVWTRITANALYVDSTSDANSSDYEYLQPRDSVNGYAYVTLYSRSNSARYCYYNAYDQMGNPISNPSGYGAGASTVDADFSVALATTTIFEIACVRPEVTIGTTTYPAEWATSTALISVGGGSLVLLGTLPPVTVTIVPQPVGATSTEENPYTNRSFIRHYVRAENAEYCEFLAYRNPDNTSLYTLSGWTDNRKNTDGSGILDGFWETSDLSQDTNFVVRCYRSFDRNYFATNTPEYANAFGEAYVRIASIPAEVITSEPEIQLYANPLKYDAENILANAISNTGFYSSGNHNTQFFGSQQYMRTPFGRDDSSTKSITFPFPYAGGNFDIHFAHCDEADGDSFVRLLVNGVSVADYTMDTPNGSWAGCGNQEYFFGQLGTAVSLDFNDDITIECTPDSGEACRIESIVFAKPGDVIISRAPGQTDMDVDIFYDSRYTTGCNNQWAYPAGGSAYRWTTNSWRDQWSRQTISTTTQFTATCYRSGALVDATEDITIYVPGYIPFSASVSATAGECLSGGVMISAPPGYMADPVTLACVPAADLGLAAPSDSDAGGTNNVDGTYDLIEALIVIQNYGPGALATTSGDISYMATVSYMPSYTLRYGAAGQDSSIGDYGAGLAAPVSSTSPTQSSTLTRDLEDVPFGTHTLCGRVNLDYSDNLSEPDLDGDGNQDLDNNQVCSTFTLPVPEPPMNLTANPTLVRDGQGAELTWDINITYHMDCTVVGPGGINESFNTSDTGPAYSNTATVGPLSATSEFVFQCTEDLTNTTFTRRATVELVPDYQEI